METGANKKRLLFWGALGLAAAADTLVRASLAFLATRPGGKDVADKALLAYNDFQKVTSQVLLLSRENTNVRSLVLTLDRKTKTLAMCDEALRALEDKVHADMAKGTRQGGRKPLGRRRLNTITPLDTPAPVAIL